MVRIDQRNWFKVSLMFEAKDKHIIGTCLTNCGYSDWAEVPLENETDETIKTIHQFNDRILINFRTKNENNTTIKNKKSEEHTMAVKIRLKRMGAKKAPFYRIVVADSRYPRDGRFIEEIGSYNPCVSPAEIKIDADRAKEWIKTGAQPTETVRALLKKVDVL